MKIQRYRPIILVLMLAALLLTGMPTWALAQCGGSGSGSMHDQHMGSSGHMMYGTQTPAQPDPNAGYYTAPAPGYADPQNTGNSGQMMNQGGMGSGHSGHMGSSGHTDSH